jgi:hypothetical protein
VEEIRVYSDQGAYQLSDNPELGYEYRANYRATSENWDYQDSFPYINAHGFRDIERSVDKPEGVFRVALIGDSVIAGNHSGPKETLVGLRLDQAGGEHIEVMSFGVGGYNFHEYAALLASKVQAFSPDLVVLLVLNDDAFRGDKSNNLVELYKLSPLVARCIGPSHLFRLVSQNSTVRRAIVQPLLKRKLSLDPDVTSVGFAGNRTIEDSIQRVAMVSKQLQAQPVVILWPEFFDHQLTGPAEAGFPFEMFHDQQIPVLSIAPLFRTHYSVNFSSSPNPLGPRLAYAPDTCHPHVYGHALTAKLIWQLLQGAGYLPAPNQPIELPEFHSDYP